MTRIRLWTTVALGTLLFAGALLVWKPRPPERRSDRPAAPDGAPRDVARIPPAIDDLNRLLSSQDRPSILAGARALRRELAEAPASIAEVAALLRDPEAPLALAQSAAVVLGSLEGDAGKRVLLEALRNGVRPELERTLILALGMREPDDGEAFARDDHPNSVVAAPGLVVFVHGPVEDPETRAALARRLQESEAPSTRLAAARVLRDSTEFAGVREALGARLDGEPDSEVMAEAAAALATWAGRTEPSDPEREATVSKVFDAVPRSDEIVRFRLAAPMASGRLTPREVDRLRWLTRDADPDVRAFAIDVLGRRLGRGAGEDQATVSLLCGALLADANASVREAAALRLGTPAPRPEALEALISALGADADWEVRAAAARSLGVAGTGDAARQALQSAAESDPHPQVRAAARDSLARFR